MLADTRILSHHRSHSVLWERDPIVFPDQTTAQLHRVRKDAIDQQYLRGVEFEGRWIIFDLRSVHRSFAQDIAQAPPRDVSGTVLYTLRAHFGTVSAFMAKAVGNGIDSWRGLDGLAPPVLRVGDWIAERGPVTAFRSDGTAAMLKAYITGATA